MANNKKIPQASVQRDTRVSKPRNPESIVLPEDQGTVKDEFARTSTSTNIPSVDPRLTNAERILRDNFSRTGISTNISGVDPRLADAERIFRDKFARTGNSTNISGVDPRLADVERIFREEFTKNELFPEIRKRTPQETFEPSKIGELQDKSLSDIPNPRPQTLPLRDPREEFESRDSSLFQKPPRTQLSVAEDGSPVIRPVIEQEPEPNRTTRTTISDRSSVNFGNNFEQNSRRRAPPPVSFNPINFNIEKQSQIPLAPGINNLPKEWQNLPENFQNQLRRLLPIYYDITGPNSDLTNRPPYVPPSLFNDGEPNPNTEDFLGDKDQGLDTSQFEPPNRSNIDFLNLLMSLFNLISSLDSDEIKGDNYEVVVFTKTGDDKQRSERSEPEWQATIREKEREESGVKLGGRNVGNFTEGDPFPVVGSEVTVQTIETGELEIAGGEKIKEIIKVILSNGEEILKAVLTE